MCAMNALLCLTIISPLFQILEHQNLKIQWKIYWYATRDSKILLGVMFYNSL